MPCVQDPGPPRLSFGLERVTLLPRVEVFPPHPHSTAGRGRQSQAPAAFCSAWDGRDPARCPALLIGWAYGCVGAGLFLETLSPFPRGAAPQEPSALERLALPRGVCANRFFFFATWSWPSCFAGGAVCFPQKPQQGPAKAYSFPLEAPCGAPSQFCSPRTAPEVCLKIRRWGLTPLGFIWGKLRLRDAVICSRSHSNMCQCQN